MACPNCTTPTGCKSHGCIELPTLERFYADDFDADKDEFACDSVMSDFALAIVGAFVLGCAGMALIAAFGWVP